MPARRAQASQLADSAPSKSPLEYWLNIRQMCDGDLAYLERKQAEQRVLVELEAEPQG